MKINIIWILGVCLLSMGTLPLQAQQCNKNLFCMERLKADNPWIGAKNGAGLIFNRFDDFSFVEAGIQTESGRFRNITDPTSLFSSRLTTESFRRINRLYMYGYFEFRYTHRQNQTWSSLLHPENTFFIMADSVPGRQTEESYRLRGEAGYLLGEHWAIGADICYHTAFNAKRRDIRNKNTYMEMSVNPGVIYRSQYVNIGLNFTYERMTEKIENKRFGTGTNQTLFFLEGLWFYNSIQFTGTTSESRQLENNGYGGAAQLELLFGDFHFFNQFSGTKTDQLIWINHVIGERGGEMEQTDYKYIGTLLLEKKCCHHELRGYYNNRERLGFQNIQRNEIVDGYSRWVQYGRKNKNVLKNSAFGVEYSLYKDRRNRLNNSWRATVSIDRTIDKPKYKLYPVTYEQEIKNTTFGVGFRKNFRLKPGCIDVGANISYKDGDGTMLKISSEDPNEDGIGLYTQLTEQLEYEYNYLTADYFLGDFSVRYTFMLNRERGYRLYTDLKFTFKSTDDSSVDGSRRSFEATVGFCF